MKKLNSFPPPIKKGNVKYDIIKSPIFKNKGVYFYVYLKEHLYSKYMHVYTYITTKDIGVYLWAIFVLHIAVVSFVSLY